MPEYKKVGYLTTSFKMFHLKDTSRREFHYHYHDFHKILILLGGDVTYCIEGRTYQLAPGDIVLVNAGEVHKPEIHSDLPYERIILYVSPDFLTEYAGEDCDLSFCFKQAYREQAHILRLQDSKGGRLGAFGSKVTEPEGVFLQLQRNEIGHTGGVLATVGLRHGTLGHKTVFGNDIRHSGECASVTQRMFQQPLHCFVVQRLFRSVDDALQEKVGLLQLVPKERIYLRELERPETIACKGFGTHHVQPCEEPATP